MLQRAGYVVLVLGGIIVVAWVLGRLAKIGARPCEGVVVEARTRHGMTGSPPYVPLISHMVTVQYVDQQGRERTFTSSGPRLPAVGETVSVEHRERWPQLPTVKW